MFGDVSSSRKRKDDGCTGKLNRRNRRRQSHSNHNHPRNQSCQGGRLTLRQASAVATSAAVRVKRRRRASSGPGKPVVRSPFAGHSKGERRRVLWEPVTDTVRDGIMRAVKQHLAFVVDVRRQRRSQRQKQRRQEWKKQHRTQRKPPLQRKQGVSEDRMLVDGEVSGVAAQGVLIGMNQVTRALENERIDLFLLCGDLRPAELAPHLHILSALRGVPMCVLPNNAGVRLGKLLGVRVAAAVGFWCASMSPNQHVTRFVEAVKPHCKVADIEWLRPVTSDKPAVIYRTADVVVPCVKRRFGPRQAGSNALDQTIKASKANEGNTASTSDALSRIMAAMSKQ